MKLPKFYVGTWGYRYDIQKEKEFWSTAIKIEKAIKNEDLALANVLIKKLM